MASKNVTKVVLIPYLKQNWLLHAWREASKTEAIHASSSSSPPPRQTLQESMRGFSNNLKHRFDASIAEQWQQLQTAKEGSFRSYLYKLAQLALSREDPMESFLKSIPKETSRLEVFYPSSMDETLVRRRLRLVALRRGAMHKRRILGWGLITLPQLPLMITPLPNVTLYYSVWRLLSNIQATNGAQVISAAFSHPDSMQLQNLHRTTLASKSGVQQKSSWRRKDAKVSLSAEVYDSLLSSHPPRILLSPCEELDKLTKPMERWRTPLSDAAVASIGSHFKLDSISLQEHLARLRRNLSKNDPPPSMAIIRPGR